MPVAPSPLFNFKVAAASAVLTVTLPVHTPDTKVSEAGETTSVPPSPLALSGTVAL